MGKEGEGWYAMERCARLNGLPCSVCRGVVVSVQCLVVSCDVVSCVVSRVSCVACRVSCVVCRV